MPRVARNPPMRFTDAPKDVLSKDTPEVTAEDTERARVAEEERQARIKEQRLENLKKATARAREVMEQRRAERAEQAKIKASVDPSIKTEKQALKQLQEETERQRIALKWARLEKQRAKMEKLAQQVAPLSLDEEDEPELVPIRRGRPKKAPIVEPSPPPVVSQPVSAPIPIPQPLPAPPARYDPLSALTTVQIREDLRKMQLNLMAKQLWGNL